MTHNAKGTKAEVIKLLREYQEYEANLIEKQVADGGPRPVSPSFSFARFFNWINDLEQP